MKLKNKISSKIKFELYGIYRTIIFFCFQFFFVFIFAGVVFFISFENDIYNGEIMFDTNILKKALLFIIPIFIGTILYVIDRIKRNKKNILSINKE